MDNPGLGTLIGCATALAFAGVLAFAAGITCFATALAFAFILALTAMLALVVCEGLQRNTGMRSGGARGVSANCKGTCHKAGDCRACNHCFGWSDHLSTLSSL
jgi:hypothetical protein